MSIWNLIGLVSKKDYEQLESKFELLLQNQQEQQKKMEKSFKEITSEVMNHYEKVKESYHFIEQTNEKMRTDIQIEINQSTEKVINLATQITSKKTEELFNELMKLNQKLMDIEKQTVALIETKVKQLNEELLKTEQKLESTEHSIANFFKENQSNMKVIEKLIMDSKESSINEIHKIFTSMEDVLKISLINGLFADIEDNLKNR